MWTGKRSCRWCRAGDEAHRDGPQGPIRQGGTTADGERHGFGLETHMMHGRTGPTSRPSRARNDRSRLAGPFSPLPPVSPVVSARCERPTLRSWKTAGTVDSQLGSGVSARRRWPTLRSWKTAGTVDSRSGSGLSARRRWPTLRSWKTADTTADGERHGIGQENAIPQGGTTANGEVAELDSNVRPPCIRWGAQRPGGHWRRMCLRCDPGMRARLPAAARQRRGVCTSRRGCEIGCETS